MSLSNPYNDWTDFGVPPLAGGINEVGSAPLPVVGQTLAVLPMGQAGGGILSLQFTAAGDRFGQFAMYWSFNADGSSSVQPFTAYLYRATRHKIPFTVQAPYLRLDLGSISGGSYNNVDWAYTSAPATIDLLTLGEGNPALHYANFVGAGVTQDIFPFLNYPGRQQISVITAAASYDVYVIVPDFLSGWTAIPIGDEVNIPYNVEFAMPVDTWGIRVINNDAAPVVFRVIATPIR